MAAQINTSDLLVELPEQEQELQSGGYWGHYGRPWGHYGKPWGYHRKPWGYHGKPWGWGRGGWRY